MDNQASLDKSLEYVHSQAALMRKALETDGRLMLAIKHASTMLGELRTESFSPKQYYELYIACFDALSQLGGFLKEDHKNHHLADMYEMVQYTGNIVPRLYLMITVGSAYMSIPGAPVKDVLKDLLEMCRGIQNPLRGLFLRYYLGQRTREFLPSGEALNDSIRFTLTNFIEMNKLWVRYQHQGHSREWNKRLGERKELQIIVGSNLVRLAQLDGVNASVFSERILPHILDQVVQCRDVLAQEYLLDVIVMGFPAEFHLDTLSQYLDAVERLTPQTSLHKVLTSSIDRLVKHINESKLAEALKGSSLEATPEIKSDTAKPESKEASEAKAEAEEAFEAKAESTPEDAKQEPKEPEAKEPEAKEPEAKEPEAKEPEAKGASEAKVTPEDAKQEPKEAEKGQEPEAESSESAWSGLYDTYWRAISQILKPRLSVADKAAIAQSLIQLVLAADATRLDRIEQLLVFVVTSDDKAKSRDSTRSPEPAAAPQKASPSFAAPYTTEAESEQMMIVNLLTSLLGSLPIFDVLGLASFHTLLKAQDTAVQQGVANQVLKVVLAQGATVKDTEAARKIFELFALVMKAGEMDRLNLAELVLLLRAPTAAANMQLLRLAFQSFREGGVKVIQRTYPSLVSSAFRVLREFADASRGELFKFINKTIHDLAAVGKLSEHAFRLYVFAGSVADQLGVQEASYEFYVEAFALYEEQITDSRAQYQAICILIGSLQRTLGFSAENFEMLASRCAMYGQKLLKKPEQCRAVYLSAHLWWSVDEAGRRNDAKVLEALQRAFSVADACMDTGVSIGLFVEVLDRYLYFYDHESHEVTPAHVNRLIEHISKEIETNEDEPAVAEPKQHFERTMEYIRSQVDSEPRFAKLHT